MNLNSYSAERRLALFDDLKAGREPAFGTYDESVLKEARTKGSPQMGSTRYSPHEVTFEFIYPDSSTTATILAITLQPPERIVFLPVPAWVVENIWQGDVDGSYHFEGEARRLYEDLGRELEEDANVKWFGPRPAKRRE